MQQSVGVGVAQGVHHGVAQAGNDGLGVRTVRSVDENIDPEDANDGVDRPRPVGGDLQEAAVVDDGALAGAGREPLDVEAEIVRRLRDLT